MNDAKGYLVYVQGKKSGESYLLFDTSREEFMGLPCIKGTYHHPSRTTHWLSSRTMYIPLKKVLIVVEYDSPEAYREAIKRSVLDEGKG